MATPKNVTVKQDPTKPEVPYEVLAQSIQKIADGFQQMSSSRLRRRALLLLLADCSGESITRCGNVLDALGVLKDAYLK